MWFSLVITYGRICFCHLYRFWIYSPYSITKEKVWIAWITINIALLPYIVRTYKLNVKRRREKSVIRILFILFLLWRIENSNFFLAHYKHMVPNEKLLFLHVESQTMKKLNIYWFISMKKHFFKESSSIVFDRMIYVKIEVIQEVL